MNIATTPSDRGTAHRFLRLLLAAFALSAVVLVPALPAAAGPRAAGPRAAGTVNTAAGDVVDIADGVDIAEDGTRFAFDEQGPLLDNGYPAYGNAFVTQGYLYPKGTLHDTDGVLPDGSPEFPDLVLGTWICWGFMIGDGADTVEGPWVISTQLFEFGNGTGVVDTIVTVGTEAPPGNPAVVRAVTGGTGRHANVRGQVAQTALGFNASEGVNSTVDFDLIGARRSFVDPTVLRF